MRGALPIAMEKISISVRVLDRLTRSGTGFRSWADLEARLKAGYVPTLLPQGDTVHMALRDFLQDLGYNVWPPHDQTFAAIKGFATELGRVFRVGGGV